MLNRIVNTQSSLDAFLSFLVIALPFALITGPAIPDIITSIIAIYFLYVSISKKYWHFYKNPIFYGFVIFSSYGILRSVFSEFPLESLTNEGSAFYFRYIFFSLGIWYLIEKNPKLNNQLLISILICILLVSIDGMYQYFSGTNLLGYEKHSQDRLTGLFGKEPIIGRYISFLSILAFALMYQNSKISKKKIIFSIAFLIMSEVVVFFSGERAPFLYLILFSIMIIIYIPNFRIYRIIGFAISSILILFIVEINPVAKKRMVDHTIEQISETNLPYLPYTEHHEQFFISSLKMFIDNPVFGLGTNTFRHNCKKEKYSYKNLSCGNHPHNYYIQILSEMGLVGFVMISSFFLYLTNIALRQIYFLVKANSSKLMPFSSFLFVIILIIYWWPIVPHMSLYNNWNNVMVMLPLGFFMKYYYSKN